MNKFPYTVYVVLFLIAFAVKFAYLQERSSWPDFGHPALDSKYHDDWALALATGEWTGRIKEVRDQPFFRAPLYPYFMAFVYKIIGHNYYWVRLIQMIIGAMSAVLVFQLARTLFDKRSAWIAFLIYLAYWPVTYFEAELLIPVLILFLDLLALVLLIRAAREGKPWLWMVSGAVLGLSAIARPNILLVVPFIAIWIWMRSGAGSGRVKSIALTLIGVTLVVLPVTIRNVIVGRDFVPIASQGGVNFYIGNNSQSDGVRAVVPGTRADWWGGFDDTNRMAEEALGHPLKPSGVSNYWFGQGLRYLAGEPLDAARLYARKVALLVGNGEISNNRQLYFTKRRSLALSFMAINFAILLAGFVIGVALQRRENNSERNDDRALLLFFIVPYAVSVILFFVTSRYRLPIAATCVPFAAYGIASLYDRFRSGDYKRAATFMTIALVVFVASLANPLRVGGVSESRGYYSLGVDYSHDNYDKALEAFNESISRDRSFAPAYKMRGWVKYKKGMHREAIKDLEQAVGLDSTFTEAFFTLGVVYQVRGLHQRAGPVYARAIELEPYHTGALTNLADVYMRLGDEERAHALLRRALDIDSDFANARFGLGTYYERVGRYDDAIGQYRAADELPQVRLSATRLLARLGRLDEAEILVNEWRVRYPNAPDLVALETVIDRYR